MAVIREMKAKDAAEVRAMMRVFYDSPAVLHDVPDEIIKRDVEACIGGNPFVEGFVFEENGQLAGYGMIARSFSTEFGGNCIWVEDIYLKPEFRGSGIGRQFLKYVEEQCGRDAVLLKLEAEESNAGAVAVYRKCGYEELPYMEMIKVI